MKIMKSTLILSKRLFSSTFSRNSILSSTFLFIVEHFPNVTGGRSSRLYHLSRWIHYGTSPTEKLKITTEAHEKQICELKLNFFDGEGSLETQT